MLQYCFSVNTWEILTQYGNWRTVEGRDLFATDYPQVDKIKFNPRHSINSTSGVCVYVWLHPSRLATEQYQAYIAYSYVTIAAIKGEVVHINAS